MRYTVTLVVVLLLQHVQSEDGPVVETNVGRIRGLHATDGNYTMFLGIPYAQVDPDNPFGKSMPQPRFEDIFEAFDDSAQCPQGTEQGTIGIRDCLVLHVYVPNSASPDNHLPVMVWIHGGAFNTGSAGRQTYGPKYIVRHDVILVSINYRLGPYGFMCLNIPEVPGNQGFKDQVTALRWINDNIEYFGGDVDKINLFGQSAGAMAIDFHLRSPEKLFSSVNLMSGSALRGMNLLRVPNPSVPILISEQLGFVTDDIYEALSFLASSDPQTVISGSLRTGIEFRPCVEQYFEEADNFLVEYPINTPPNVKYMPILIGYTNDEQLYIYANFPPQFYETLNVYHDLLLRVFEFDEDKIKEIEDIVRRFYLADEDISYLQRKAIIDFDSDIAFNYPAERSIKKFLDSESDNIFFYVFGYNGGRNLLKNTLNISFGGTSHGDDLGYLFDVQRFPDPTAEDQLVIDRMTAMWTNFAKYGNPTPTTSDLLPVQWEPITKDTPYNYLDFNLNITMKKKPFHKRMAFWDLLWESHQEYERGYKANTD